MADAQIAQLAGAHARAAEDLDDDAAAHVAAADIGADAPDVERDRRFRHPEAGDDLARAQALGEEVRDESCGWPELAGDVGEGAVLVAGDVEKRGKLVHLQKAAVGLGDVDLHPPAASGVVVDEAVLDRLIEDRRQRVDQLAQRTQAQWLDAPTAAVSEVGAGGARVADLLGLFELCGLELLAVLGSDGVQAVAAEEPQQV